jgi:hypothetical protein
MKLSTAIRMGSLLIENPQAGNVRACAITMACLSTGFQQQRGMGDDAYSHVAKTWPWVITAKAVCPCGTVHPMSFSDSSLLTGSEVIWGVFDHHVMGDRTMTIEQLADFIASIEPEESCQDQQPSQIVVKDAPSTESVEVSS